MKTPAFPSVYARGSGRVFVMALSMLVMLCPWMKTPAAEVFAASSHGDLFAFDGSTGQTLMFLPFDNSLAKAAGIGFRTRDNFWVVDTQDPAGQRKVASYGYTAEDGWGKRLEDARSGPAPNITNPYGAAIWQGIFWTVGYGSHSLWAYSHVGEVAAGGGLYLPRIFGGQAKNLGVDDSFSLPAYIAFSALDGRRAITRFGDGLLIAVGGTTERRINYGFGIPQPGVAFDYTGSDPVETGTRHSLVYVVDSRSSAQRVIRYDAVTGLPFGANPANRADPTFIPAGTGGMTAFTGPIVIDPLTGDIFVTGSNTNGGGFGGALCRFDKDGNPKGLGNSNTSAFIAALGQPCQHLAIRPYVDPKPFAGGGTWQHSLTPSSAGWAVAVQEFVGTGPLDGAIVQVRPATITEEINIGGAGSRTITLQTRTAVNVGDPNVYNLGPIVAKEGGTLLVDPSVTLSVAGDVVASIGGKIELSPASSIELPLASLTAAAGGVVKGMGSILAKATKALSGGTLAPGASPGQLTLQSDLHMDAGSHLEIELAGLTQGTGHDFLDVQNSASGQCVLLGSLDVKVLPPLASSITAANTFTILSADSAVVLQCSNLQSGRVTTVDGMGSFAVQLANSDHDVVLGDYQSLPHPCPAWATSFGLSGGDTALDADADGDGRKNLEEFAFNTNPATGAQGTVFASTRQGNDVVVSFTRRRTGTSRLSYVIETSTSLTGWAPLAAPWAMQVTPVDASFETVTLTAPASGQHFVRVQVTGE
ncbi:MAG: hypothetical protein HS117_04585 [Verrucomicrobiaceae bacterium]|nr:hypothetical protein [Verrucomicrobiaceae bacterium]